jgi:hypothetical protein
MLMRFADHRNPGSLAHRMRATRFRFFRSLLDRLEKPVSILDVGGRVAFWQHMGFDDADITVLNMESQPETEGFKLRDGDARDMRDIPDDSYDVVFSNSVIEHVGTWQDQQRAAAEMRRVGRRYFVQTPNRYFPLEPHFLVPGFQFLPVRWRAAMLTRSRLGWIPKAADYESALETVRQIRLLTPREVQALFPGASIYTERLAGLPKSYVAYDGW